MLEVAGLEPEEERAYRLLVQLAGARAAELAQAAALPEPDAAGLLETLRRKGLAVSQPDDDGVFRPVPPDLALGATLARQQETLEAARHAIAALTEEYRASARRHDADQLVEVVTGATTLRDRLRHLQESAQQEMLWFCRANPVAMSSAENTEEFTAMERGVGYRVLYERSLLEEPGMLENVAEGIRRGEQARTLPALPVRLAIADASTAVCPLVPAPGIGEPTAAFIGRSQLLDALIALFESFWDRATPVRLTGEDGLRADSPGKADHFLLSLLVAGVPDKSIASQMGISRRTVQRRVAALMALASVDTRPGLAFQAARRGWV